MEVAESAYATALHREEQADATCVDWYFRAAAFAWTDLESDPNVCGSSCHRTSELYHSALSKLITTGQRFRRFDPRRGLSVQSSSGWLTIPTIYRGFPWKPKDFNSLISVGDYSTNDLNRMFRCRGLGVPTVATHCRAPDERFRRKEQVFAATVVLQSTLRETESFESSFVLGMYDPVRVGSVKVSGLDIPLHRDLTAPFAYRLNATDRNYLNAFLQPGTSTNNAGLFMLEPYQPDKIPLVLVHGLLSDPFTWANIANEIRACPDLCERYQIWGFEYPTGEPFLASAAALRRQLLELQSQFDPDGDDSALSQAVLVGHSMGGLVAKLQVTCSGNQLWQSVSDRSFESIVTTAATRAKLTESFFFEPVPMVSRVIFIGTPHQGSSWAIRPIGKLGSALVNEPSSMESEHAQLIRDNRRAFSREFTRRIPTSIDLLSPTNPSLEAISRLRISPEVKLHTILGSGYWMVGEGESDGVVPVSSARFPGVVSEKAIDSKHSDIHQKPEGINELFRILRSHLSSRD